MITGRPAELAAVIRTAVRMEAAWLGKVPQPDEDRTRFTPWMPFPVADFIALAAEALPEVEVSNRALEIGCGIGTKMILLQEVFGLDPYGIERNADYAAAGLAMGLEITVADALAWQGYAGYGLTWFNRVFRDPAAEAELEPLVWAGVSPGTVVMCANLEDRPPGNWYPVLDAWADLRRGIWQKPFVTQGS